MYFQYLPEKKIIGMPYNIGMEKLVKMRLWEIRTEKGITLQELSHRTGISKSTLANYENEKHYPSVLQLAKIASALDTKIDNLYESPYK